MYSGRKFLPTGKRYIYIMYCIGCKYDWVYRGSDGDNKKLIQCPCCKHRKVFKDSILRKINITTIVDGLVKIAEKKVIDNYRDAPKVI
jgi:hypothetical protein